MKTTLHVFTISLLFFFVGTGIMRGQTINDLIGKWDAYAPDAPEEYQKSLLRITKDSVFVSFDGVSFMPSNSMEFKNDTLRYEVSGVFCTLTFESKIKMKGISNWASGQSEILMTKKDNVKPEQKK